MTKIRAAIAMSEARGMLIQEFGIFAQRVVQALCNSVRIPKEIVEKYP